MNVRINPLTPTRREAPVAVCVFPHAGGSPRFFRPLAHALPADFTMLGLTYPGRDMLLDHPSPTSLLDLARHCASAILAQPTDSHLILFGHSLGSYVAFETARALEECGLVLDGLVVSGADAPSLGAPGRWHCADDITLTRHLADLDPRTRDALAQPGLARLLLPMIRADYRLVETYLAAPEHTVDCPIFALRGALDTETGPHGTSAWRWHTRSEFRRYIHRGGHFTFLTDPDQSQTYLCAIERCHRAGRGAPAPAGSLRNCWATAPPITLAHRPCGCDEEAGFVAERCGG